MALKLTLKGKKGPVELTVDVLRVLLLGRLVDKTGITWSVEADHKLWDLMFVCRYGPGKDDLVHSSYIETNRADLNELINSRMARYADPIIIFYEHRTNTHCPTCKTAMVKIVNGFWRCDRCIVMARDERFKEDQVYDST